MSDNKLYVQMLGDFSLKYCGERISLERNSSTKATQLLEYIIYNKGAGISRDVLTEVLYNDDGVINPQNNLKVNIFRLRKLLEASPLPPFEYIVYSGGKYSWQSEIEVVIDAKLFEESVMRASDFRKAISERLMLLLETADLYTGDFLPMIASEPWVAHESVRYHGLYLEVVQEACKILEAEKNYELILNLCKKAVKIAPYEESLHLTRISALIDMRRFSEALVAYNECSSLFLEDLGVSPSTEMQDIYRRIMGSVRNSTALIDEVRENLRKSRIEGGAYYCNYPGFIDSYLFVSRMVERSGQSIYLMLSTLTDIHGVPLELSEKLNASAECLHSAVFSTLRTSDMFTRYSASQYLILLVGINRDNCNVVGARIDEKFRAMVAANSIRGVRIQHSFTSGLTVKVPEREMKFSDSLWDIEIAGK